MFVYAFVITAGLGALIASGVLVRFAVTQSGRPLWQSLAIGVYAFLALAGAIKFCYDLVIHRNLWNDDSVAIAVLNLLGIIMMNSFNLLPVIVGCAWLYLVSKSRAAQLTKDNGAVEH